MDYTGIFTGPEIDARLSKVDKTTQIVKRLNAVNPPRVVAGRRIPNEHWGDVSIRFTKNPTFVIDHSQLEPVPDNPENLRTVIPPILKQFLEQGIVDSFVSTKISIENNYLIFTPLFEHYVKDRNGFIEFANIFCYYSAELDSPNAIRLIGYNQENAPVFEAIKIVDSETLSPYLQIQGGNIVGVGTIGVFVEIHNNEVEDKLWLSYKTTAPCYIQYRMTGSHIRRPYSNPQEHINRKIKWSFARQKHGIGKIKNYSNQNGFIPKYFNTRIRRKIIWIRVFRAIRKGRWISSQYNEIRKVILCNRNI